MNASGVTIIMPTYNRLKLLLKCLQALKRQTVPRSAYEVVIVDDGSTDDTAKALAGLGMKPWVRFFHQDHKGAAAARNLGIGEALGELILFIGDDIVATPDLLAQHMACHAKHPQESIAVLGYVTWSPEIEVTPFMHWLENGGPQFKYWAIKDPEDVSWRHLYTANISFKRKFLLQNGLFDEDFPSASHEDTELGYRLSGRGLRIVYSSHAVGYHYHPTRLCDGMARMRLVAESRRIFRDKTGLDREDRWMRSRGRLRRMPSRVKFWLFRQVGCVAEYRWVVPGVYSYLLEEALSAAADG
jgi:GT2 family glycosyltransferase